SSNGAGMAAQLTATHLWRRRELASCIALAISSLPVPVSPRMRTVQSVGATLSRFRRTAMNLGLDPITEEFDIVLSASRLGCPAVTSTLGHHSVRSHRGTLRRWCVEPSAGAGDTS